MSCQIREIANISDVDNIKKLLYSDTGECEFFVRYDSYNIHGDLSLFFFQSSIYRAINYLFKIALYRYRRLEMYLRWLGREG